MTQKRYYNQGTRCLRKPSRRHSPGQRTSLAVPPLSNTSKTTRRFTQQFRQIWQHKIFDVSTPTPFIFFELNKTAQNPACIQQSIDPILYYFESLEFVQFSIKFHSHWAIIIIFPHNHPTDLHRERKTQPSSQTASLGRLDAAREMSKLSYVFPTDSSLDHPRTRKKSLFLYFSFQPLDALPQRALYALRLFFIFWALLAAMCAVGPIEIDTFWFLDAQRFGPLYAC